MLLSREVSPVRPPRARSLSAGQKPPSRSLPGVSPAYLILCTSRPVSHRGFRDVNMNISQTAICCRRPVGCALNKHICLPESGAGTQSATCCREPSSSSVPPWPLCCANITVVFGADRGLLLPWPDLAAVELDYRPLLLSVSRAKRTSSSWWWAPRHTCTKNQPTECRHVAAFHVKCVTDDLHSKDLISVTSPEAVSPRSKIRNGKSHGASYTQQNLMLVADILLAQP